MTTPAADTTTTTGGASSTPAPTVPLTSRAPEPDDAPDVGPASVHVPGQAPGAHILTGPASMPVGGKGKKAKGKK